MTSNDLNKRIAEREGERFWKLFAFSSPHELVLEDIALARGVIVIEGPLKGMEARLIRQGSKGLIRVKDSMRELGRVRFAIAHELGHWELHKEKQQLFSCTTEDMLTSYKGSSIEAEANLFAAEFLMPAAEISKQLYNLNLPRLADLKRHWRVSMGALLVRARELGCITPRRYESPHGWE